VTPSAWAFRGRVILIPAHERHVAYSPDAKTVFTGDTLFAAGCGRLFEGDAAQMMSSLGRLASLPDDTRVYCGHEYTQKNLEFAMTLEPGNRAVVEKLSAVRALRKAGKPTIPSTIAEEKATVPSSGRRALSSAASVRAKVRDVASDPVSVFAAVRALKDRF
jgi:hydroxyacylglutathione hydrolase